MPQFLSPINFLFGKFLCFLISFIQKKKRKEKTSELESNGKLFLFTDKKAVWCLWIFWNALICSDAGSSHGPSPSANWFSSKSAKNVCFLAYKFVSDAFVGLVLCSYFKYIYTWILMELFCTQLGASLFGHIYIYIHITVLYNSQY